MKLASIEAVANAVLFEGYMLYPYRPSATKNRQRWNFGTLYPRAFADAQQPPERWHCGAQVLLQASAQTRVTARARFLQLSMATKESSESWEEGFPRSRTIENLTMEQLTAGIRRSFDLTRLADDEQAMAPPSFCARPRIATFTLSIESMRDGVFRLSAEVNNESPVPDATAGYRSVQDLAFTSAHLLLSVEDGAFVSLLDPPADLAAEAAACVQDGLFPVLAGDAGDRSMILCSPIILYDYPQVAPESAGDFFDSTEMDEMLALRVLTLTDAEKEEMRRGDPYARSLLERTERLPGEQLLKVHGAIRGMDQAPAADRDPSRPNDAGVESFDTFLERPALQSVRVFGVDVHTGDRVRLWPQKKADIMDMAMQGKVAVIEAIEQDFEDNVQLAVVLEDDPGRDLGMLRQAGHRFFFSPEEVEPLGLEVL